MPLFLVNLFASKAWAIAKPWLPFIALAVFVWVWKGDRDAKNAQINALAVNLKAEQQAHKQDNAGLTALAVGTAKVAVDTKKDAQIIQETITDAKAPLSPQLMSLLDRMRAEANSGHSSPASRPSR